MNVRSHLNYLIQTIKADCFDCERETNHKVIGHHRALKSAVPVLLTTEYYLKDFQDYMIIKCAGCDTVSFIDRTYDKNGKPMDYQYPETLYYELYDLFLPDEDCSQLPKMVRDLYNEVEEALNAESKVLAGIGLRTLVEAVCIHKKIMGKTLAEKIRNLNKQGLISNSELPILDKLRLIGNVSAHEIKGMPISILKHAVSVINHLLRSVYLLPKMNKRLKI